MYRLATQTSLRQVPRSIANSISRPALATPRFIQPVAIRTMMDSPYSAVKVSDRVKHDHAELEKQYRNILAAEDEDTKVRWQNQFIWELARHSIAEEIIVYPAFEKFVPNGLVMAEKDRAEHQRVKNLLYEFEKMTPSSSDFLPTLDKLWDALSDHITEEERDDLPALEENIDVEYSSKLASSFNTTKHFVPTHSHPSAPDKPPYETAIGLLTTPMDKLIDMFRKFPKEDKKA
ncbi:hypothetical protein QR685DRAFT_358909 [Neurospora intermedia]|uniref:Hemerythrin-like domain-containing protein n=1 Tax=Neurospora intermedia TaxID=5142 RepID=A0ABR3D3Y8_NEUIN